MLSVIKKQVSKQVSVLVHGTLKQKVTSHQRLHSASRHHRAPIYPWQILPNSAAQLLKFHTALTDNTSNYKEFIITCNTKTPYVRPLIMKFHGAAFEIPHGNINCYIPQPVNVVVLTDNTSNYKEFIVTCNTKTPYVRPLIMKLSS